MERPDRRESLSEFVDAMRIRAKHQTPERFERGGGKELDIGWTPQRRATLSCQHITVAR
jgi:hypothetical protein